MKPRLLLLLAATLPGCTATPMPRAAAQAVPGPPAEKESLEGRWTISAVNGQPASGMWLELGREQIGAINTVGSAVYIATPSPRTRAYLGCNWLDLNGWSRTGDQLMLGVNGSVMTERGCAPSILSREELAFTIMRRPMTLALTKPDRLRLSNAGGSLELVRQPPASSGAPAEYRALGTEPFWSLTLNGREMVFIEANAPGKRIVQPQPKVIVGFAGEIYQSPRIGVNILHTRCSDGMSDRTYPDKVQVRVDGRAFEGCGGLSATR